MALKVNEEYGYGGVSRWAHDDTVNYEDLPPNILGGIRDYIARELKVEAEGANGDFRIIVTLEGRVIQQTKFGENC